MRKFRVFQTRIWTSPAPFQFQRKKKNLGRCSVMDSWILDSCWSLAVANTLCDQLQRRCAGCYCRDHGDKERRTCSRRAQFRFLEVPPISLSTLGRRCAHILTFLTGKLGGGAVKHRLMSGSKNIFILVNKCNQIERDRYC